jgi:hypothetical protein
MDYKTKSILTVAVILTFMLAVAIFINNLEGSITGAVVKPACKCHSNSDCNDNNQCTEDICLYPDSCDASLCVNKKIENC